MGGYWCWSWCVCFDLSFVYFVTMNVADENSTESTRLTVHSIESTST